MHPAVIRSRLLRPRSPLAPLAALAPLLLLALAACGSAEAPAPAEPPGPCAALLDACLSRQQACVEEGAEARCEPCAAGRYADAAGHCQPLGGAPLGHEFDVFTVQPGEEISGLCQSWTLGNADELWVNAVELTQDVASHHSNWTFVPADQFDGPDGIWPCDERGYDQLSGALAGGVIYAQSTQAAREVQRFASGAAVRIPPYSRIIGDVHLLNTGAEAVTGRARMTLYSLDAAEVTVKLVPFHLTYRALEIPPHATSRFTGRCSLDAQFRGAGGTPFGMDLHYLLPHHHALGRRFFLELIGGPEAGEAVLDVRGYDGEAHGRAYDPPLRIEGAEGLAFGCEFENPRSESVGWGIGDQEMCEVLGFADMPVAFESSVKTNAPAGAEGDIQLFEGSCSTLAFAWSHDKEGGPPPP